MLNKCANPSCGCSFRYLRSGRLFLIENGSGSNGHRLSSRDGTRRIQYFWLCERCAPTMIVQLDGAGNPVVKRQPAPAHPL
jgi:hypothetical protein